MFTKRIGIDLGTANSVVWLARLTLLFAFSRYGGTAHRAVYGGQAPNEVL
jgi:molecular chaperone DnaK (HSP70)